MFQWNGEAIPQEVVVERKGHTYVCYALNQERFR